MNFPDIEEDLTQQEMPCQLMENHHVDCPLCKLNSTDPIVMKMNAMEESLSGKIAPSEIYHTLYAFYKHQKQELERQHLHCPTITIEEIKVHYEQHKVNLKNIVANEIFMCNEMGRQIAASQIAMRDVNGTKTIQSKMCDQWIRISKHKLDLVKYYQSLSKKKVEQPSGIKPMEFD